MKIFEATQRWGQPTTVFYFSWMLVTIHDSSTTNVLIYNLLQTTIAHPLLEGEALEEEVDPQPHVVEGPPPLVADLVEGPPPLVFDMGKEPPPWLM